MIQASTASSAMRVPIAPTSPIRRALPCCAFGSFPAIIEMKMMLSMPSTISSSVNVSKPTQASGCVSQLMAVLKWESDRHLCAPPPDHAVHFGRPAGGCRQASGNQGVDRAQHVIGEKQPDLVLCAAICVVAPANRGAILLVLEGMIAPAPLVSGANGMIPVEGQRVDVWLGHRVGRDIGVRPEGAAREEPYRAVVRPRIRLGSERRSGIAVVEAALRKSLHLLVILEHCVFLLRQVRRACDVEGERLEPRGLSRRLVVELYEARNEIDLSREIHRAAILMRHQLSRPGHEQRSERAEPQSGQLDSVSHVGPALS